MRKVELLPARDCEAGYGPAYYVFKVIVTALARRICAFSREFAIYTLRSTAT